MVHLHGHGTLFSPHLALITNVLRGMVLAGPVLELAAACLSWQVYKDHVEHIDTDAMQYLRTAQSVRGYGSHMPAGALGGGAPGGGRGSATQTTGSVPHCSGLP